MRATLESAGVPVFLPTVRRRRSYGGRVRTSELPLFNGYVFYAFDAIDRIRVLRTYGVVRVLQTKAPRRLAEELAHLRRALDVGAGIVERVDIGPPGTLVEVVSGPLLGTRGELLRHASGTRLVLRVGFLGFGAAIDIDEAFVRRAEVDAEAGRPVEAPEREADHG